jgi:hypothetical protein
MEYILEDMVTSAASLDDYEFANGYVLHVFNCSVQFHGVEVVSVQPFEV